MSVGPSPPAAPPPPGRLPPDEPVDDHRSAGRLVADLLGRCRWPPGDGPLVAAVSGGPDSLALLVLAVATGRPVTAVHVDHGMRPDSAADGTQVAEWAAALGAGCELRTVVVDPGANVEARARTARYSALPPGVLVGHTADDRAETVLLNLLRGAGLDGLAGMHDTPRVRRPLLGLRRHETWALCAACDLVPLQDPSNADDTLRRNAVRHRLLPLLAELSGRDPVPVLIRQSDLLGDERDLLDGLAAALDPTDARGLAGAPVALARRAVRTWLRTGTGPEQHPPGAAEVERVLAVARGEAVATELAGGRRVRRHAGRLSILPE